MITTSSVPAVDSIQLDAALASVLSVLVYLRFAGMTSCPNEPRV